MHKLILASESPRRKNLLEEAGFLFRTFSVKVSENIEKNLTSESEINSEIQRIARIKGQAALAAFKPLESGTYLLLSADTLVILDHEALGKPISSTEAEQFLSNLSNKTHQVKTAFCLIEAEFQNHTWKSLRQIERIQTTAVTFRLISRQEILDYISTGEPMDKAGAYGIQGQARKFVSKIEGPLDSVIGLPIQLLEETLLENKIEIAREKLFDRITADIKTLSTNTHACLLAVSKFQTIEKIAELAQQGQKYFAENYVQEALEKIKLLHHLNLHWHFIGHLQKNKVKLIVGQFDLIHSVDSIELAEKISLATLEKKSQQKILLQINLAQEDSKGGFSEEEFKNLLPKIQELPGIKIVGLMTMPPLSNDPEESRPYFRRLRELAGNSNLSELSMGTSSDYKVALQEGATWIRLGTILFGERPRKNP
jgi:PLP dependent protein